MRALTCTDFPAVTTVLALVPTFFPMVTFVTPLTLLSAACTFGGHPDTHRKPDTSRVTVCSLAAFFSEEPKPAFLRALMRTLTCTDFPAVTTVLALVPTFFPTVTFVTPLTLLSAACTFLGHPAAHLRPVTSSVTVCSSAATTTGAAKAPAVSAATAAIVVIMVFILVGFLPRGKFLPCSKEVNTKKVILLKVIYSRKF
jgi:hypothetical protein